MGVAGKLVNPTLDLRTEIADQALDRPRRSVPKSTDRVAFHLFGHVEQHVDFALVCFTTHETLHDAPHPARAFTARCALAAAFVLEEVRQPSNRFDDIGRLVHDDHGSRSERRLALTKTVEIHRAIDDVFCLDHWARSATGDHGEKIIPAATDTATMLFDELTEGDAHFFFDGARRVDVTDEHEQLGANVVWTPHRGEPGRTTTQNRRSNCDRL